MADHAAASPSSAGMWMNCPASITLAAGRTRPSSRYAREGTAAHSIAETILSGNPIPPSKITVEGEQFIVGLPMLRALEPYIDIVEGLRELGADVHVEKRVKISSSDGWVWGTTDCAAFLGEYMFITDLKYGKGVRVSPDSEQLRIYALAAIETLRPDWTYSFGTVVMTICQPRIDPQPSSFVMSAAGLALWRNISLFPAIDRIVAGDQTEVYGHWCRWCVRRDECNAFKFHKNANAAQIFDDGLDTLSL